MASSPARRLAGWTLLTATAALAFSPAFQAALAEPRSLVSDRLESAEEDALRVQGLAYAAVSEGPGGFAVTVVRYAVQSNGEVTEIVVASAKRLRAGSESEAARLLDAAGRDAAQASARALDAAARAGALDLVSDPPMASPEFAETVKSLTHDPYGRVRGATCGGSARSDGCARLEVLVAASLVRDA